MNLFFSTFHLAEENSSTVANSALQEELTKTQNDLYIVKSDLERADNDKRVMLDQLNNALSETEGLKSKVDNFNNIFSRLEREYTNLSKKHKAKKQEAFNFKFELTQVKKELHNARLTLEKS
ncbi:hypothetical protein LguiB_003776 [Lonicera macranthoides]